MNSDPHFRKFSSVTDGPAPVNSLMENARWGWHQVMLDVLMERKESERRGQNEGQHPKPAEASS